MMPLAAISVSGADALAAAALVLASLIGYRGVRASAKAQQDTASAQAAINSAAQKAAQEQGSGEMALALARELRTELVAIRAEQATTKSELQEERDWREVVHRWYEEHEGWDIAVLTELERLVPGARTRMPPRVRLPNWRADPESGSGAA